MKAGGVFYTSFKFGEGEKERKGRLFTDFTSESFSRFLETLPFFKIEEEWVSRDVRPGRESEQWLNVIVRKDAGFNACHRE